MTATTSFDTRTLRGYILLLLTSLLWGTAFIFQKNAAQELNAFSFNFLRFGLAIPALLLLRFLPVSLFMPNVNDIPNQRRLRHSAWFIGAGGGVFMFLGISLQQWGLAYTTAGKSGFLTSLYIILVPILALFFRQRCHLEVWLGAMATLLGVYLLGIGGGETIESQFNKGDVMTLLCAIAWAAQVLWLGSLARYANVLTIATIQMLVIAILSGIAMVIFSLINPIDNPLPTLSLIYSIKYDILYTGIISAAVAFTLQILGQRYVPPTNAALIMSVEAVFALLAGMIFLDESATIMALLGCFFILLGVIVAQLEGRLFKRN
ncbi:MAG: hypothetical protein CSA45_01695 [Gammaproteobacteria bacterium]|nr:MAG: hypothetical protein CSA45_01695 [Gammaproteobacteria bacterium]